MRFLMYVFDIIFLFTIISLAIIPKKKKWVYLFGAVLIINVVIRLYYIREKHTLTHELQNATAMAAPPTLYLGPGSFEKTDSGCKAIITFIPSKNQPLGLIMFAAQIIENSESKITTFKPEEISITSSEPWRITPSGKSAVVIYSQAEFVPPKLVIEVTDATKMKITGNYLNVPVIIDFEKLIQPKKPNTGFLF